jgi:hypothetical protein
MIRVASFEGILEEFSGERFGIHVILSALDLFSQLFDERFAFRRALGLLAKIVRKGAQVEQG